VVCLIAGWALDQRKGWLILPATPWYAPRVALSSALVLLGLAVIGYCAWQFKAAQTHIEPWRATTSIVTAGPYRFSRNPIYLAMTLVISGIGITVDGIWVIAMLAPTLLVMHYGVIAREERYLEAKFGKVYLDYKRSVRRWI